MLLAMLGTSSPSYLIMASMDLARDELENIDKEEVLTRIKELRSKLRKAGIRLMDGDRQDITRLCVLTAPVLSGLSVARQLEEMGIYPECADEYAVIFILTHKDGKQKLERLYNALTHLEAQLFSIIPEMPSELPERVLSPAAGRFSFPR